MKSETRGGQYYLINGREQNEKKNKFYIMR